jgi:hypothetical protein
LPGPCIPQSLAALGSVILVTRHKEILPAALEEGIFLTSQQLTFILTELKIGKPAKGSGSGVKGNVIKVDLAWHLIKAIFPDAGKPKQRKMVAAIMKLGQSFVCLFFGQLVFLFLFAVQPVAH